MPYLFTIWLCGVLVCGYLWKDDLDLSIAIPVAILLWPLVLLVLLAIGAWIAISDLAERIADWVCRKRL